ncbi:MAG: hypothetical protein HY886_11125 [Deltaproteobacteria bacterium]|nr:hypothetical protein [Deltaproteobacteria bacterium]
MSDDRARGNAVKNTSNNATDEGMTGQQVKWWRMPFDATTNFSLIGWIFGNRYTRDKASRTDIVLK